MAKHPDKGNKDQGKGSKVEETTENKSVVTITKPPEPILHVEVSPVIATITLPVDLIPDPREHPEMNIRSVIRKQGQTQEEAVFQSWNIRKLLPGIENGSIEVPPIDLVYWTAPPADLTDYETGKKVPCFPVTLPQETADKLGLKSPHVFQALADGNCRTICKKILKSKYPAGKEVTLIVTNPDGTTSEKKVLKTYNSQDCNIRMNLSPRQYRALQQVTSNRQSVTKSDVARMGIEFILQHPTLKEGDEGEKGLEAATLASVGAWNVTVYTKAEKPHGAFQEWWRAALSPRDMREGFLAYLANVEGVSHPNQADFRDIHPHIQMEILSFTGGEVKPGVYFDSRIKFQTSTFADIEGYWKSWTPEQCKAAAERAEKRVAILNAKADEFEQKSVEATKNSEMSKAVSAKNKAELARRDAARFKMAATKLASGLTPDKLSEALAMFKGMASATKQAKKVATMLDGKALAGVKGELFNAGTPEAGLLVDSIRGAKGAPEIKVALDLSIRLSKFFWELADEHAPEEAAKFRAEIEKLQPLGE